MARTVRYSKDYLLIRAQDFLLQFSPEEYTIRKFARFAGCSTQPVYKQFSSFEELMRQAMERQGSHHFFSIIQKGQVPCEYDWFVYYAQMLTSHRDGNWGEMKNNPNFLEIAKRIACSSYYKLQIFDASERFPFVWAQILAYASHCNFSDSGQEQLLPHYYHLIKKVKIETVATSREISS